MSYPLPESPLPSTSVPEILVTSLPISSVLWAKSPGHFVFSYYVSLYVTNEKDHSVPLMSDFTVVILFYFHLCGGNLHDFVL